MIGIQATGQIIEPAPRPVRVPITLVLQFVSKTFNVTVADIKGTRRPAAFVLARHVAFWLLRAQGRSYPEIALHVGGRDHTTVLSAVRRIELKRAEDPALNETLTILAAHIWTTEAA